MIQMQANISGEVQGVRFRAFVQDTATDGIGGECAKLARRDG